MTRVFVTGANGFIGAHLVEALLDRGDFVTGLVRPSSDTRALTSLFPAHGDRLRLVEGDLRDPRTLRGGLEDAEIVYHLAAVVMGTTEADFQASIVDGTRNLLDAVKAHGRRALKRFLHVSSLAAAGPARGDEALVETDAPRPVSWYGRAKRDAEEIVSRSGEAGLPVTIVRPVAVYGEREKDIAGSVFPAVRLGVLPRIGAGKKTVSVVHVEDLVQGILAAAERPITLGRIYFLGEKTLYDASALPRAAAEAMGTRVRIPVIIPGFVLPIAAVAAETVHLFTRRRPALTRDKAREVLQSSWACSPSAAERDFGWVARIPLGEGMKRAVRDWDERRRASRAAEREPLRDRATKTYLVALGLGVVLELIGVLARLYTYHPWWFVFVAIGVYFGGVIGTLCLVSIRWRPEFAFLAGVVAGTAAELLNAFWLDAWTFGPFLARIPGPWLRSIVVLGIPVGVLVLIVNEIVRALYAKRLERG